ncbi:MAG: hypothetical protein U1F76_19865 [Candidatus Competibacteraceae bacterium]
MKIRRFLKNGLLNLSGILMAIAAVAATAGTVTDDWSWLTMTAISHERGAQALDDIERRPVTETAIDASRGAPGWFLVAGHDLDDAQRLALQSSLDRRSDDLSMRFFRFLWSSSPFPQPYAYLFILLVLTLIVKFLELPFLFKTAQYHPQRNMGRHRTTP